MRTRFPQKLAAAAQTRSYLLRSGSHDSALRRATGASSRRQPRIAVLVPLLDRRLQPHLDQTQHSRSTIRRATHCISSQCGIVSKDTTTHYPSSALPRTRDHHASASPVPRTISGGPPASAHARRLAVRAHSAGRQQVADPRRLDGLQPLLRRTADVFSSSARWMTCSVSAVLPMLSCAAPPTCQ